MPGPTDQPDPTDERVGRLEQLLAAGRALTSELDLPAVLDRLVGAARSLTGARYAALGVLDEQRSGLAEFVTVGFDDATRAAVGELPRGHGVLGLLIDRPQPIRLHDISQHPRSYGFPPGHPPMRSFLGAPIAVRGEIWGNLYLAEKQGAEDFDDDDLEAIVTLAQWAGVAIDNARLFGEAAKHRQDLERTMATTLEIATAIGSDTDLARILELIAARARELVSADGLLIWLHDGSDLSVAAVAGNATVPDDATIPLDGSTAGEALRTGLPVLVDDARELRTAASAFGMGAARSTLIVPLMHRGRGLGVLVAFDRVGTDSAFGDDDERALVAFAANAATAVATARLVESQRLQDSMAAAEAERTRWARELHDETLQGLASLKILLAGSLRASPERGRDAVQSAVERVEHEIAALRTIIADLRPAALDELGLQPALRTLLARVATDGGLSARLVGDLGGVRLSPALETVAYRVAQEALTNVAKHAAATEVVLEVCVDGPRFVLRVADDGRGGAGDDAAAAGGGYGIVGMRERAALAAGSLDVAPRPGGGTVVTLDLPRH